MAWWTKRLGTTASGRAVEPSRPVELEVVPGKLSARVYLHDIDSRSGPITCWSYVSAGMSAVGQTEIVFTLRRGPDELSEDFPHDPLHLLATLYQLADQGTPVGPGEVTEFGDPGFFGHHLLYVEAQPLSGVPLPPSGLSALLITTDELRAVREFGPTRVLARMGQAGSHYPFPPWADRRSPGLSLARTFEHSVLSALPRVAVRDVRVGVETNQIIVSALRGAQRPLPDWLAELAVDVPPALLTGLDLTADGCLVWAPGQSGPEAITWPGSAGSRLCGCFVVFVPTQPQNGGRIVEDGFVVELTSDSWKALRGALIEEREIKIPASGTGMSFVLTWRDREYLSPIDGRRYAAEGGWDAFAPTRAEDATAAAKATITNVRLLTPEREVAARSSIDELAAFCQAIQRCAVDAVGERDDAGELSIRVRCTPEGHDVSVAGRGEVSEPVLQAFGEAVRQLAGLPVQVGEVSFEIELSVSPGQRV